MVVENHGKVVMQTVANNADIFIVNALLTMLILGVFWFLSRKSPPPPALVVPDSTTIHFELNSLKDALAESTAVAAAAEQKAETMNNMVVKLVGQNQLLEQRQNETQNQLRQTQLELAQVKKINSDLIETNKKLIGERDTMSGQIRELHQEIAKMTMEFRELRGHPARGKNGKLHSSAVTVLRHQMVDSFNESELRTLITDLDLIYENIDGENFEDKVRELISYVNRHNRVDDLLSLLTKTRPDVMWVGGQPNSKSIY